MWHYELDKEPMLYQRVTGELFEMRIKELTLEPEMCSKNNVALTFEEGNAVHYVGDYVVQF